MNTCLPNGNEYGEIDLKIDNIALQTTFPYLFNLPFTLKSCTTKEKSLATLCNIEQVYFGDYYWSVVPSESIFCPYGEEI